MADISVSQTLKRTKWYPKAVWEAVFTAVYINLKFPSSYCKQVCSRLRMEQKDAVGTLRLSCHQDMREVCLEASGDVWELGYAFRYCITWRSVILFATQQLPNHLQKAEA